MQHITVTTRLIFLRALVVAIVALLVLCVSCSHPDDAIVRSRHCIVRLLDRADALLGTNDSAALVTLDSIDATAICGRKLNARYALLYSEAMYKNYIPATSDSLIMVAVKYYSTINKTKRFRFRSYYTLGCLYNELEQFDKATVALSEAEGLANEEGVSDFRRGLLYFQLGSLYVSSKMYLKAESYYIKAAEYYESAKRIIHQMSALFYVARCKFELEDYENSYSLFQVVLEWSRLNSVETLYFDCLRNMMSCSLYMNDIENNGVVFDTYISNYSIGNDDAYLLTLFAKYHLLLGNLKEAESYIEKAWNCNLRNSDSVSILYVDSRIQKELGNLSLALSLYEQSISLQNKDLKPILQNSALSSQNDYFKQLSELESIKASRRSYTIVIIIIITSLLIVIGVLYHLYNKQKLQLKIEDSLAIISDLTEQNRTSYLKIFQLDSELRDLTKTNDDSIKQLEELKNRLNYMTESQESSNRMVEELNDKVRDLFSSQYSSLDRLYQEMTRLQDVKHLDNATFFLHKVSSYFKEITSKSNQRKLDKIINDTYNNLMIRLSDSQFDISESDMTILRLLIIGYSVKTIGGLTGNTSDNVYQKRHRIVNKISGFSESLANELRKALRMSDVNPHGGGNS